MNLEIEGKVALVLGASAGIGRAIAHTLAKEGAKVVISARGEERLMRTAEEIGAARAIPCDLSKPGAASELVAQVERELKRVDILVTNTGGPPAGTFESISSEQWQGGFQGLWMSAVDAIRGALPGMQSRKWGRVLLVTSVAAKEPIAGLTVSNALRAGLLGLTKSISQEVAEHGVTINALLPGYTKTERLAELGIPEEKMVQGIPAKRLGHPDELAALSAFLASEHAGYVTGQAIACDGGVLKGI